MESVSGRDKARLCNTSARMSAGPCTAQENMEKRRPKAATAHLHMRVQGGLGGDGLDRGQSNQQCFLSIV